MKNNYKIVQTIASKNIRFIVMVTMTILTINANALSIKDSTVFGKPVHVVDWIDNDGKPRKVAIVKDIFPQSTGVCVLIKYYDGTTPVTITSSTPFDDVNLGKPWNVGFGCTVHHNMTYHNGGTLSLSFQGPHHAVFNWVQTLDGSVETVTYTFLDGLDYFQWQETVNGTAGTMAGDSRGPYCTMQWDGVDFSAVTGQEYGAQKYFSQPSYNGAWTFSGTCDIPYVLQWDNNREVGYVQTQTFTQQMAGVPTWSGSLNLPAGGGMVNDADVWMYDYQMNFYDKAKKITWGLPYGYMNADPAAGTKSGWGQYSLSIVFDGMAEAGVKRVRDENRVIQNGNVSVTATKGSIVTTGPVGTVNPTLQTLSPAGFDHNYRTWWIQADGTGESIITMAVNSGSLRHPTFRIKSMSDVPGIVEYNSATLIANTDYYASFNSSTGEAWVTILRNLSGSNTIRIVDGNTSGIVISAASVTPSIVVNNISNNLNFSVTATDDGSIANIQLDLNTIGGGTVTMNPAGGNNYTYSYTLAAGAPTGTKTIIATVTDNLGNQKTQNITLTVNAAFIYDNIYTDPSTMVTGQWAGNGVLIEQTGAGAPEGVKNYNFNYTAIGWYAGFGLNLSNWSDAQAKDFSTKNTLELSYSGPTAGNGIAVTLAGIGNTQSVAFTLPFSATYTTVQIPMSTFSAFDLTKIVGLNFSITGTETGTGSINIDNIRLIENAPLPINLLMFNANQTNKNEVELYWATTSETNNSKFSIERSSDGEKFNILGHLDGNNGTSIRYYNFTDKNPEVGYNYYRLRQEDFNHNVAYSEIKIISINKSPMISYNYLEKAIIILTQAEKQSILNLKIQDISGKELFTKEYSIDNGINTKEISVDWLKEGVYLLFIEDSTLGINHTTKIYVRE